ncbi:thioesterase II family protein [Tenggerimyces flavus]|uniref:Thioesterase II family protein n=1 Tax=Tenggerimyces flavus TaxID=1708749 RepID=A0ABV7YHW8_9ACTN|nr:alpha/beta fold hydrolase [Tenggerimyces flavus]MBM7790000.1 surfactin synthase thioesterase subunit [Tenggerimyces flavus]
MSVLLCLPFAGAGAGLFHQWRRASVGSLDIRPLLLPGRESRIEEEPHTSLADAVADLFVQASKAIEHDGPIGVFGHSLGAVLGYELAWRLVEDGRTDVRLFASGSPAPWRRRVERAKDLSDDEFVEHVEELAGYRHEGLHEPELRELLLPALRADVELHEAYAPTHRDPLPAPIVALRGTDDLLVSRAETEEWKEATSASFELVELTGGHMYLVDAGSAITGQIERRLHA